MAVGAKVEPERTSPRSAVERRLAKVEEQLLKASRGLEAVRGEIALLLDRRSADLVGVREAAELLGVPTGLVSQWLHQGTMPEPLARLASGPVWSKVQIVDWQMALRRWWRPTT